MIVAQLSTAPMIFRYSRQTLYAASFIWAIFFFTLSFFLFVALRQVYGGISNWGAFFLPLSLIAFWTVVGAVWLRRRPALSISEDGIGAQAFLSQWQFVCWKDIRRIEDVRLAHFQTGREYRYFRIVWDDGEIPFNEFYSDIDELVSLLNEYISLHSIEVWKREKGQGPQHAMRGENQEGWIRRPRLDSM